MLKYSGVEPPDEIILYSWIKRHIDIKMHEKTKNGYTIPSQMCPCTTVHELVGEIKDKIKKQVQN